MKVIKRNGSEVEFDSVKIEQAIEKANNSIEVKSKRIGKRLIKLIAEEIAEFYINSKRTRNVEYIQDLIENKLIEYNAYAVAKEYITYRYKRTLARTSNTTDDKIMSLIEHDNEEVKQENSNKNPIIASTQRDYIAGEVSKDITNRILLSDDIVEAHNQGIIHFHDADYFAQHMFNCFVGHTTFVTDTGIRRFDSFNDGDPVYVKDKDGCLRLATVRKYGKQSMNKVTLSFRGGQQTKTKEVICTANHRWILQDGTITTNLQVGDYLYHTSNPVNIPIETYEDAKIFCLGFVIGDGSDSNDFTSVRLCNAKKKYSDIFNMAGFSRFTSKNIDDIFFCIKNYLKQDFLNGKGWRYLTPRQKIILFRGLFAADGSVDRNEITTADERVSLLISEVADFAGFYISSKKYIIHNTNFKQNAKLIKYHFITKTKQNYGWRVVDISPYRYGELKDAWCVDEPITHSFMLSDGVVTGNCCLISLEDMLQNGTVISGTMIEKPHSFSTACNIATQIIAQVASNQYGGQTISLAHLAPFVEVSRQKIRKDVEDEVYGIVEYGVQNPNLIEQIVEKRVKEEIKRGIQTIQYQVVTLMTTNGQAPFLSVNMYLNEAKNEQEKADLALIIEEVLKQRIEGVKNEKGVWVTPAFPKLLYVLQEDNIHPDDKYYYLTELAAKCTAKRMVPDYISEKKMKEYKINKNGIGDCFPCMGCRSFLTPWTTKEDKSKSLTKNDPKYYGRFNQGVVTINLVDAGLAAYRNLDDFWDILNERLELCHKALQLRHERLAQTLSDTSPIHWQHGAIARLNKGESIHPLLHDGYSTISLGYAGLWECVYALIEKKLTEPEGKELGLAIMQRLNDKCQEWKQAENIDYSVYGTPIESTTYKFAKACQERYGIIPGVTDKNYISNSYHIHVAEPIDAFSKLQIEADFQKLSPGGAISYVEVPNLQNNIEAVLTVIKFIYDNIMYAELNTKSDYCHICSYDGEIVIKEDDNHKLFWECPNCGNRDQSKMNVARRTCGYIGSQFWNQGRTQEIKERVLHLGED